MLKNFAPSLQRSSKLLFALLLWALLIVPIHTVMAVKPSDGLALSQPLTVTWRYQSDQTTNLTPASDKSSVFVPLAAGVLIALNAPDGKLHWKADAGGEFSISPTADERYVYAATQYSEPDKKRIHGTLRALSKATGVTLWMRTLPAPLVGGMVAGAKALFAGDVEGRIYSFDKHTGLTLWINQFAEGFSSQPTISGKKVFLGTDKGTLLAVDVATGEIVWLYKSRGAINGPAAVADGIVYFGSGDGNVYALSELQAKPLWHRRTGAAVQAVAVVDNGVLAASLDNFAYLLSPHKGSLIWRRQLPGRISSPPLTASDGALFTPLSTENAIVLNLRDGKPANSLALGEENSSGAGPITVADLVLITTPHGLLAFSAPQQKP
jgi:eukaryotic-like serine/threonine-protein kinase